MIIEILTTGDEILTGAVVDTNSAHIAQALKEIGLLGVRHSCVGDDMNHLVSTLQEIANRADVAVVTGGLGPTTDDITAEAASKSAGVELVLNRSALRSVEDYFRTRNRPASSSNKKQALLPFGAEPIYNPVGTAPGFTLRIEKCLFYFLPGVPFEMHRMLSDSILPSLETLRGRRGELRRVKTISTFGLTESATGERMKGFSAEFPGIKLGFRAKFPEIQIKLYGSGKDSETIDKLINKATESVLKKIGENVFSVDGMSMEGVVGRLLSEKKATLAVAESCTGGLISHMLTNIPGSSKYFLLSGITYSNEAKTKMLDVSPDIINQFGAVHEKTAKKMAEGVRRIAGATYGLAVTGIAGPDGGTDDKPVGTVCLGLADARSARGFRFYFPFNNRSRNKKIFAMKALDILRQELMG
ncbi:MAG: competence/damage-inducible protein A [Desulfobacteraceae bacterium]|nr:competence/damage-inducible protein A [Desulfobacteraceae bacterium]